VRPGFINTKQDFFFQLPFPCDFGPVCTRSVSATDSYTGFSLDVGGVAEIYPSKRIVVRFDVGDTIANRREPIVFIDSPIFNGQQPPIFFGQSFLAIPGRTIATHNLQLSAGVGFRF
jgi:hypothetical protein